MIKRLVIWLIVAMSLAACAALVTEFSGEMDTRISTEVAVQVGTELAKPETAEPPPTQAPASTLANFDCEVKYCKDMSVCAEAVYKLTTCDHSRLDSDGDGVPCESICTASQVVDITGGITTPSTAEREIAAPEETGRVTRVIDGDTIDVLIDGVNTRIRYLQMNTPERDEPCYREATQANADLVSDQIVRLVPDKELVDRYDRLLRYIYVGEVLVNRILVEQGFAEVALYPPNDAHYDEFLALEQEAAAAGRGCHPSGIFNDGSTTR